MVAHLYQAVVPVNDVFGKPQAKSRPGVSFGGKERLEKFVRRSAGNTAAVVHHGDSHSAS